jgi:L-ascorbate metabolism protein UlaG (beta-lactamase superfamily)
MKKMKPNNSIRLLRHATLYIEMNSMKLMVDPMLSGKDEMDPVKDCGNDRRIPMTDLPFDREELNNLLAEANAVIVTHTHRDHWDTAAQDLIDKNKPIFCQPPDVSKIMEQGFKHVIAIDSLFNWNGITFNRTSGRHGSGEIGAKMGEVSGFVLDDGHQSIYIAGDTIWCEDVDKALDEFKPTIVVVNAGAARFLTGGPITMTAEDIVKVHEKLAEIKIVAVHMDTVNHCFSRRDDLARALTAAGLQDEVLIPADGEKIEL